MSTRRSTAPCSSWRSSCRPRRATDRSAPALRLLPWTATLFVVAPIAGALVNRVGERPLIVGGLFLQAVGMAWIALIAAPDLAYAELVAPLIVAGAGVSMAMPAAQNAVVSAVAKSEIGKASGTFNMLRFLGGVFGIAITVAAFAGTGGVALPGGIQRRIRRGDRRRRRPVAAGSGRRPLAALRGGELKAAAPPQPA